MSIHVNSLSNVRSCCVRTKRCRYGVQNSSSSNLIDAIQKQTAQQINGWIEQQQNVFGGAIDRIERIVQPKPNWLPPGPSGDVTLQLTSNPVDFLTDFKSKYGGVGGVVIGGDYAIMVGDSQIAKQVLVEKSDCFQKEGTALFPGPDLAGQGLLVTDGEVWKRQRRISNPAFRASAVRDYRSIMEEIINNWLNQKKQNSFVCDFYQEMNQLTLQVVVACLFGSQLDDQKGGNTIESTKIAFQYFATRSPLMPMWFPTWDNFSYLSAVQRLDKTVYGLTAQRRRQIESQQTVNPDNNINGKKQQSDLLGELLAIEEADDQLIRDQLMTFLIAGQETSAIVISWTIALLVANPEIQQQLYNEIKQGNDQFAIAVLLESMRLYPPAYIIGRCANQDVELNGNTTLKKGTSVFVSPYLLHRDEKLWENPSQFRPNRWLENLEINNYTQIISKLGNQGIYIPFGAGPRNCIGAGFAMEELILLLKIICEKYILLPDEVNWKMPETQPFITLRPENFLVKLQQREK